MKFVIIAAFVFMAVVTAVPIEQPKGEPKAIDALPEQAEKQGADDLKAEETFWGGFGRRYYGGWGGGYYAPSYHYARGWGGWGGYGGYGGYDYPYGSWVRTYWY